MCDEDTEAENAIWLRRAPLGRRELGIGAGATLATLLSGCGPDKSATAGTTTPSDATPTDATPTDATGTRSRMVSIETPDGTAEAFFVTPASGRHPGVLIWPDIAGLRDAFQTMATRLAGEGYAVLAVNQYYRSSKVPVLESFAQWRTEEGRAKLGPMIEALSAEGIASDGAAFVAWLDEQQEVDPARKIGTTGYCMGGPFTFRTAAAAPERVGALGSFHGGGLVTDQPDSPHTLLPKMKAAALVCVASNDDERDPAVKTKLGEAATAAGVTTEIEVYPAQHGWCVLDSPVYDEAQAERAWSRLLATFAKHL